MGPGAAYSYIAMGQAIADAGLSEDEVVNPMTGLIAGSGGPSTSAMLTAHQTVLKTGATKRIGPFAVPKCMSSTVSANLATAYRIKGMNFSITSACSTSLHCIGMAAQQMALGQQDVMFAGGGEELDWTLSCLFDAMGAMSSKFNDTPERASRAFDADRDGFVISGGGAMVVLEPLERAVARGAQDLRRGHGLRRHLRRGRHGGPLGRGRRAGHARRAAHAARGPQGQLHQRPRHLHAGGRRGRDRGRAPRLREGRPRRSAPPSR
jgi:3-oxoacyl-(acyl-carrier-protein) synthase